MDRFDSTLVYLFGLLVTLWGRLAEWLAAGRTVARRVVPAAFAPDHLRAPRPGHPVVTAEWLNSVLFASGSRFLSQSRSRVPAPSSPATPAPVPSDPFAGDRVTSAEVKGLDGNRGLAAAVTRVHVTFAKRPPTTFILKMSRDGALGRRAQLCTGQTREGLFYSSALASDPRPPKPAAFYTYSSTLLGEWVMLLEDLSCVEPSAVHVPVNMVFGNQIWGIPAPVASSLAGLQLDPVRVLESIYLDAADMHAAHWRQPALLQSPFLKAVPWFNDSLWARACWESSVRSAYRGWLAFKKKVDRKADDFKFNLSPKLAAVIDASFTATSWEAMRNRITNKLTPFTLCHGDFHAANMLLLAPAPSAGQPAAEWTVYQFDWSEVGAWQPMADLAQMMISDVKPELFPKSRDIVRKYWQRLTERGVSPQDYPWEDCWEAFCRTGVERWIWVFGVMCGMPGLPAIAIQYFHDQILKFIEAHGDYKAYAITSVVTVG